MNNEIIKIINEWDPINLFPMAPKEEYYLEISIIQEFLSCKENQNIGSLSNKIMEVFENSFGKAIFNRNSKECIQIAERILMALSKESLK